MSVPVREVAINGKWPLLLPEHRAARPEMPRWEELRLASMHTNLRPGMVVFDVGAEEGDHPALWRSWGCDVVLIEPNPRAWPNMRLIWEANGLGEPAAWFAGFASSVTSPAAALAYDATGWPESASGPVISDHGFLALNERPDVERVRLDTLADWVGLRPDAITMDIEGAEYEALRGAPHILEADRPLVWVSVHPPVLETTYASTVEQILDLFAATGYVTRWLAVDHEYHLAAIPREREAEWVDVLDPAARADADRWATAALHPAGANPDALDAVLDAIGPAIPDEHGWLVDLGCGTGTIALPIAATYPTAFVHGVDLSVPAALEYDREAARRGLSNTRCLVGDGRRLPQLMHPADAAWSVDLFDWLDDDTVRGYLAQVAGLLRPGGRFRFQFTPSPARTSGTVGEWCHQAGLLPVVLDRDLVRDGWSWITAVREDWSWETALRPEFDNPL